MIKSIKDLVKDRLRKELSEDEIKVDATEGLVAMLCHVDMIPLVQLPVYYEQNKSTGYN